MMGSKAHYAKMPYSLAFDDFSNAKDEIVKYCDEVIAKFSDDERYECIVEEMDRLSADSNSGFLSFNSRKFLWGFVLYSVSAGILAGEKVKYLNHFCRITGIDRTVLSEMEDTAKTFVAIGKKRKDAKTSTRPYAEVVAELAALDVDEATAHKTLCTLLGLAADDEIRDDAFCDSDYTPTNPLEQIGDGICEIIEGVTGGVCDVIDGIADGLWEFSEKL
jgi:hypothetical protein